MEDDLLYTYDGYLNYDPLAPKSLETLRQIAHEAGLRMPIEPDWLEFSYSGKDGNRNIVSLLSRFAALIGDSDGEIVCRIERDAGDFWFEFFTIREGHLFRQLGNVIRGEKGSVA